MAGLLPLVRGFATNLYPVTRRITFQTKLMISQNANEQRWKGRNPLMEFTLPYSRISAADLVSMRAFWESNKGPFDSTWGMVLGRACLANVSGTSLTVTASAYGGGPFRTSDTGSQIVVVGAGPSAGLLVTTMTVTSSTTATLATAASVSVTGADTRWGQYFPNLMFTDQQFPATEEDPFPLTYTFNLKVRQGPGAPFVSGSGGSAFPTFPNGTSTTLPYIRSQRYSVMLNDNPHVGQRYSWSWWGAGIAGFPTGSLRGWELSGSSLTDADLPAWENHFRAQWGRFGTFSFTDPDDAVTKAHCRYDNDALEIQHVAPNVNQAALRIMEFNASASPI